MNIFKKLVTLPALLLFALTSCSGDEFKDHMEEISGVYNYPEMYSATNNYISDMCLIYHGRYDAPVSYDKESMKPYVYYTDSTGKKQFLYDAFLFLEIKAADNTWFEGNAANVKQDKWQWIMDRQFEDGYGISAIDEIVDDLSAEGITPIRKRKVVVAIPMPYPSKNVWGTLDGEQMVMNNDAHRLKVVKWYIDEVQKRWKASNFKNLELAGFYWIAEKLTDSRTLLLDVKSYVKQTGHYFYWIPYFGADGGKDWKQYGFDVAYQQPNYFFVKSTVAKVPATRLNDACQFASRNNMGLEFEFDGNMLTDTLYQRKYTEYIDYFKANKVFDEAPIAYYEGGGYWNKIATSTDPVLVKLHKRLADLIAERQRRADKLSASN